MSTLDLATWDAQIDNPSADKAKLYEEIKSAPNLDTDANLLWRLTKACLVLSDVAIKNKQKDKDREHVFESLPYAKKAIELGADLVDTHKWYCAAVGRAAPYVGTKERIQYGHEFKKHSDIATEMAPDDHMMHHM